MAQNPKSCSQHALPPAATREHVPAARAGWCSRAPILVGDRVQQRDRGAVPRPPRVAAGATDPTVKENAHALRDDLIWLSSFFGMNQSLDGYVDHTAFGPSPTLFRHVIEEAQGQAGSVYGRQMYEVMRLGRGSS